MPAVKATLPRWLPLLSGMVGTTTVGMLLYVWSVFIKPFNAEFGWTRAEISLAFSIYCLAMGLGSLPVGRWNDRVGPRIVVFTGGILMGAGFILSGFITSKYQLYLT